MFGHFTTLCMKGLKLENLHLTIFTNSVIDCHGISHVYIRGVTGFDCIAGSLVEIKKVLMYGLCYFTIHDPTIHDPITHDSYISYVFLCIP